MSDDVCYDNEAFLECEKSCRWLLEKGHGPDYTECVEVCWHKYLECDYDEWMGFSEE